MNSNQTDLSSILMFLQKTKHMFLMSESGALYILKGYEHKCELIEERTFFKGKTTKDVDYVASITYDDERVEFGWTKEGQAKMRKMVYNQLVPDRKRYITMLKHLHERGCTIKRK